MLPELPLARRLELEMDLLGFAVSAHPLELLPPEAWRGIAPAARIAELLGKPATMLGWAIAAKRIHTRKDRRIMKFLSLEDLTGVFEATLFPKAYERFAHLTLGHGPYRLKGKVEEGGGTLSLNIYHLERLPLPGFRQEP